MQKIIYHATECPHCGNEITVNNAKEIQKCLWCRRPISVKLERISRKKVRCKVEAVDFCEEQKQNFSKWKGEEFYGHNKY